MTTATANPPIRKGKAKQTVSTADMPIQQKADLVMPELDQPINRPADIVRPPHGENLRKEELEALAFAEEPVKIEVFHASGDNPSPTTDYIANNGIAAQVLVDNRGNYAQDFGSGRWVGVGYLIRGVPLITKRKFLGELAKSKQDTIQTEIKDRDSARPQNIIHRRTSAKFPFQVIEDRNPKGVEWLRRLMYQG